MEYTRLGSTGLKVSRIALGCMSFGDTSRGFNEWSLGDDAAEPLFRQAVELGVTFWDTANVYSFGTSEEIVGRAVRRYTRREDVVLATKVFFKMHDGPGGSGLSRRAIMEQMLPSIAEAVRTSTAHLPERLDQELERRSRDAIEEPPLPRRRPDGPAVSSR